MVNKCNIMKLINEMGYFWINDENQKVPGIIIKDKNLKNFFELKLLEEIDSSISNNNHVNGIINGNYISCIVKNVINKKSMIIKEIFTGNDTLKDDIGSNFSNVIIHVDKLNYWYDCDYIKLNKLDNNTRKLPVEIETGNEDKEYQVNDNLKLIISKTFNAMNNIHEQIIVREIPEIKLVYHEPVSIKKLMEDVEIIRKFFIFVFGMNFETNNIIYIGNNLTKFNINITDNFNELKLLFRLTDVKNLNLFEKWFELCDKNSLKHVIDIYTSLYKENFVENKFIGLTKIIEAYHRQNEKKYERFDKSNKTHYKSRLISLLMEFKNTEIMEDILRINYSNFKSINYDEKQGYNFKKDNDIGINIFKFATLITENRNFYTHIGNKKDNILNPGDLIEVNRYLLSIIDMCFLNELNFFDKKDMDYFNKITYNKYRYNF